MRRAISRALRALEANTTPVFPRLQRVQDALASLSRTVWEPTRRDTDERIRMLEAKVEYLLDELYRVKSIQRLMPGASEVLDELGSYQVSSFDYQWGEIVYHDEFLSNPDWAERAPQDVCDRVDLPREWFAGKRVLDCGCGPGRHAFAFATMGAEVVAFDLAPRALENARTACSQFGNAVTIEERSILAELPYPEDFDLVWCYGVLHHTGNTRLGLANIAKHAKPGGKFYTMLYAEPRRAHVVDYQYHHEVAAIREAIRGLDFEKKSEVCARIEDESKTLGWFDAISSEINDLYTFEEISAHLVHLGFSSVKRTMPHENNHNVVATRLESAPDMVRPV